MGLGKTQESENTWQSQNWENNTGNYIQVTPGQDATEHALQMEQSFKAWLCF